MAGWMKSTKRRMDLSEMERVGSDGVWESWKGRDHAVIGKIAAHCLDWEEMMKRRIGNWALGGRQDTAEKCGGATYVR